MIFQTIAFLGLFLLPTPVIASTTPIVQPEPIPALLQRIMKCESQGNTLARNKTSSAKGLYQFLDGSWNYYGTKLWGDKLKEKDVFNSEDSTELALYVYKLNGTKDWNASKACWNPTNST